MPFLFSSLYLSKLFHDNLGLVCIIFIIKKKLRGNSTGENNIHSYETALNKSTVKD